MNIKYDSAIRMEGVDCFIISYFKNWRVYMIMFHQIFLLEHDWSERSTWPNIPQPKLQTLRPLRLVIVSDVFKRREG